MTEQIISPAMISQVPRNRTQKWLARGVVGVAVIMLIVLKLPGIADVRSVKTGEVTTYLAPPLAPLIFGVLGALVGVAAIVYWMQRSWLHRGVSVVLAGVAVFALVNAPTGLDHRLVVTPDFFFQRIGSWYAPLETKVQFNSLMYITVTELKPDSRGRKTYELRCVNKTADETRIAMNDFTKKALPEILRHAAEHDVPIGDGADPRVIALDR